MGGPGHWPGLPIFVFANSLSSIQTKNLKSIECFRLSTDFKLDFTAHNEVSPWLSFEAVHEKDRTEPIRHVALFFFDF